jgi:hypothetical protein
VIFYDVPFVNAEQLQVRTIYKTTERSIENPSDDPNTW